MKKQYKLNIRLMKAIYYMILISLTVGGAVGRAVGFREGPLVGFFEGCSVGRVVGFD